jgi:hypothetical protein
VLAANPAPATIDGSAAPITQMPPSALVASLVLLLIPPWLVLSVLPAVEDLADVQTYFDVLRNKHLIFLGDSITRYQYLDLLHLLTHSEYLVDTPTFNIINEHTFPDFNIFYNRTNGLFAPYEKCDCFRDNSLHNEKFEFENRYYYNPTKNLSLSYIMFSGRYDTIKGHWCDTGDLEQYRDPVTWYYPEFWSGLFVDKMDWLMSISPYKEHILLMNVGHHPLRSFSDADSAVRTVKLARDKFNTFIWKTTTYGINQLHSRSHDDAICAAPASGSMRKGARRASSNTTQCLDLSWTKGLNASLYWDDKHFLAPVYNAINSQLIHLLADIYHKKH